ncbi:MAG: ABC transporter permease [Verrucomicrobia bacterium]|nr:ABC transporter permease [Verrucomicrobiota bacterium]
MTKEDPSPSASWTHQEGRLVLVLSGRWHRGASPVIEEDGRQKKWPDWFETSRLGEFDSTLPAYLLSRLREIETGEKNQLAAGLPENLRALMELALGVPEQSDAKVVGEEATGLRSLGKAAIRAWEAVQSLLEFTGQTVLSLGRFVTGRASFRSRDFWLILQECGVQALPIVALISLLIGMILAFVGNIQLANFGADLYVADLVGLAMVREMGAVMTAIIMSGRTGAAFAASLGSMNANQEIDALRTFGFNPFDFLVLPRLLALVLMMPLLTIFSNVIGIFGGMLVAWTMHTPPALFYAELLTALNPTNSSLGVFKSVFFGAAIAVSGCLQGMKAGNSSAAVGAATTRSVVESITAIVVLDSIFALVFTILDI